MLYQPIFALHLLAAGITGVVIIYTLYCLARGKFEAFITLAILLGCVAAFEVATGTLMAVLSPTLSALALVSHIVAYLGVCLVVEGTLFFSIKKHLLTFPTTLATVPVVASTLFFTIAIMVGA